MKKALPPVILSAAKNLRHPTGSHARTRDSSLRSG